MLYIALTSLGSVSARALRPSLRVDFTPIRKMFSFSYKILITTVVNTVSQNFLTVIFGRLYPANAVGNFTQAFQVGQHGEYIGFGNYGASCTAYPR